MWWHYIKNTTARCSEDKLLGDLNRPRIITAGTSSNQKFCWKIILNGLYCIYAHWKQVKSFWRMHKKRLSGVLPIGHTCPTILNTLPWECTGFDARPARAMGKPNARKCVRWSREKRCRVAKAIRAGFSSGAVLLNSKFHGDVLVLTPWLVDSDCEYGRCSRLSTSKLN